jgi:hypothetical protein
MEANAIRLWTERTMKSVPHAFAGEKTGPYPDAGMPVISRPQMR